jgi:hypothetical protein
MAVDLYVLRLRANDGCYAQLEVLDSLDWAGLLTHLHRLSGHRANGFYGLILIYFSCFISYCKLVSYTVTIPVFHAFATALFGC